MNPRQGGAVRRRPALAVVRSAVLTLVGGLGACALALPEGRRPALVLAVLGATALAVALVTRWRLVGTVAVFLIGSAPLMAGALEQQAASPVRLAGASLFLLLLVVGLDGLERPEGPEIAPVVVRGGGPARRWGTPVAAVGAVALVATVAAAPAVASAPLVLLGLLAGVGAVVAATRLH
jgi:hypothetical protein